MAPQHGASFSQFGALQAPPRPLELPAACLGVYGLEPWQPDALPQGYASDKQAGMQETLRTAEFWISLLEGERSELKEDVEKQKERRRVALRQSEARASSVRESEAEVKQLRIELRRLQQAHDQAAERRASGERSSHHASVHGQDAMSLAAETEALEEELQRERSEKENLESQLVKTKVWYAETLQHADCMKYTIEHYEDQLRALTPDFEPVDYTVNGQLWRASNTLDELEMESKSSSNTTDQPFQVLGEKQKRRRRSIRSKVRRLLGRRKGSAAPDSDLHASEQARASHAVRETDAASDGVCRSPEEAVTPPESSEPSLEESVHTQAAPNASAEHAEGTPAPTPEPTGMAGPARRLRRWELRQE